ncbi:hypothetical protein FRC0477_00742 [Corynebacterium diphtheriae]|nr:hypothetical protein FRC0477_00742 [Corynebacterium diphtheriae]
MEEHHFRALIRELITLWTALQPMKTSQQQTERLGSNPNHGGPRSVGGRASELDMWATIKLREIAADCAQSLGQQRSFGDKQAGVMLNFLRFNAQQITQLDHYDDAILMELKKIRNELREYVDPVAATRRTRLACRTSGALHTAADMAVIISEATGKQVARKQITYWADSGQIAEYRRHDGVRMFSLAEVTRFAERYRDRRLLDNSPQQD